MCYSLIGINNSYVSFDSFSYILCWLTLGAIPISFLRSFKHKIWLWWRLLILLILSFSVPYLMFFYIRFELRLIPILLMILFWGRQPERLSAGVYFIIYTGVFSIPYLILVLIFLPKDVFSIKRDNYLLLRWFITLLVYSPFLVKMPVLGLHFWLPKAHVEARTRGSIVLAGLLLKLGRYGIFRLRALSLIFLKNVSSVWILLTMIRRILTFIQSDLKKLVAYRRVSHITFIIVGIVCINNTIYLSVFFLSLVHGWTSMGIFAGAGMFGQSTNSRLGFFLGERIKFRVIPILLGVTLLSNSAIPPIPSFFPEITLVLSSWINGRISVFIFIFISLLVCYYNTYIFIWVSHASVLEVKAMGFMYVEVVIICFIIFLSILSLLLLKLF